jgi:signal transduction histidine kinase
LIVGAGTIVLMLLVSAGLAQHLSSRIQDVERQVAAIAGGDFREADAGSRRDEIQELVASVNQMSRQLRQMQQTVRQSERARLLGQLAGGMAHQLRNALTGARLAVQIHARRCPLESREESLAVALRQLALTEEQVKGFLSLGRLERRPPQACDVTALVAEVAALVGPTCEHAKVRLETSIAGGLPPLLVDVDGLRSATLNLVLNAIEAAGPQGAVSLRAAACGGEMLLEVFDNGPGPPPETVEMLFEPFVTSKREGAGLGLALARQVATDHGGELTWERAREQTCFRLTLPWKEAAPDDRIGTRVAAGSHMRNNEMQP